MAGKNEQFGELQSLSDMRNNSSDNTINTYIPESNSDNALDNEDSVEQTVLDSDKPEDERDSQLNERIAKKYEDVEDVRGLDAFNYAFRTAIEKSSHKETRSLSNKVCTVILGIMLVIIVGLGVLLIYSNKQEDIFYTGDIEDTQTEDEQSKLDKYVEDMINNPEENRVKQDDEEDEPKTKSQSNIEDSWTTGKKATIND